MDTTAATLLTGRVLDERYRVGPRIARGGMAVVYQGTDTRLERTVALKIMHPGLAEDPQFVERFVREARSAARLSHPNIVAVHDQGTSDGEIYLVMEHVTGTTLRDLLRARGRLTVQEALDVIEPLLSALDAAHAAGLVHRDVKPENVLVTGDGRVKVADFGLARATSAVTNATQGVVIGTVAYISPEQVTGTSGDERSDVYSAGIVLFEMLTGAPPYSGDNPTVVAVRHANEDVPAPSSQVPGLPAALDALVAGATARDPQVRYRDARSFLAAARATRQRLGLPPAGPLPVAAPEPAFHDTLVVSQDLPATSRPAEASAAGASVGAGVLAAALAPYGRTETAVPSGAAGAPPQTTGPVDAVPASQRHDTGVLLDERPATVSGGADAPPPLRDDVPRKRPRRGLIGLLIVLGLAAVAGAGAWFLGQTPQVQVPGVVGLTQEQAQARLGAAGFSVSLGPGRFSETIKPGSVISTSPAPGATADEGSTIALTLSKGPERYAVPNLAGQTLADAKAALGEANLAVGATKQAFSPTVGKGLVIGTTPKAGTKLKKDTVVGLTVSKGPQPVRVPSVVGRTQAAATSALTGAGLKVATREEFNARVAKGVVVSQSPASGTVPRGSTVTLVVSKGPPPVTVPNVLTLPVNTAIGRLEAAGLRARVVTNVPGGANVVIQQTPGRGTSVPRGTTISLYVF